MYDVIVVGAGPAGSTAARMCAKVGLSVLLLEKDELPRYKFCGGALSHAAYQELGFSIDGLRRKAINRVVLMGKDRKLELTSSEPICYMIMRDEFDAFLVQKSVESGVEIRDGQMVRDVKFLDDRVEVVSSHVTYKGRCLIGADGCPSMISQRITKPLSKDDLGVAVGDEVEVEDSPDHIEIVFGSQPFSYGWAFPKEGGLSFGYGAYLRYSAGISDHLVAYMGKWGYKPKHIHAHLLPLWRRWRKVYGKRTLLCGDAAGFVDPFQGEGIRYAIHSGKIAAEVIKMACEEDDFSENFLSRYGIMCGEMFAKDLLWAGRMSRVFYANPDLFLLISEDEKELSNGFLNVLRGTLSYKNFVKRALLRMPSALFNIVRKGGA